MSLYKELTQEIIASCYEVHNYFGPGLLEKVYQEAMCCELNERFIDFEKEVVFPVTYKSQHLDLKYYADIVIENKVLLELKAVKEFNEVHYAQCINYLKLSGLKVCLLINFGSDKVQIKRFVL